MSTRYRLSAVFSLKFTQYVETGVISSRDEGLDFSPMHRLNKITNSLTRIRKAEKQNKTPRWLDLYVQNVSLSL